MASWTGCFLLTSTLLSSDPALLRRPRFPAQNMQYQRLDAHTRPGATAACRCHCPEGAGAGPCVCQVSKGLEWAQWGGRQQCSEEF